MYPFASDRKRTPTSTALGSLSPVAGVVAVLQMLHGHVPGGGGGGGAAAVVTDQEYVPIIALPAVSVTPPAPPVTVAVYVVAEASGADGIRVAVGVSPPG